MYGYLFWRGRGLVSGFLTLWDSFFSSSHDPFELLRERKKQTSECVKLSSILYITTISHLSPNHDANYGKETFLLRWWRAHLCESRHLKRNAPGLKDLFPRTTYNVLWGMFRVLLCQSISDGKSIGYRRLYLLAIFWRLCSSLPKKGDSRVRYKECE